VQPPLPPARARLFVAVDPGPGAASRLAGALARVRPRAPSARWVDPASLHLTLAFLGDTDAERVPGLTAAIGAVAARHAPLEIRFAGAGTFGGRRPRVLWAGVEGAVAELAALQADLAAALAPLGYPPEERPFAAHLTLARARAHATAGEPALVACAAALAGEDLGPTRVEAMVLYRSDLSPRGSVYTPLASLALGGPAQGG
jgi:2'-5' RNA ligase